MLNWLVEEKGIAPSKQRAMSLDLWIAPMGSTGRDENARRSRCGSGT
jgi:hypothetical protein